MNGTCGGLYTVLISRNNKQNIVVNEWNKTDHSGIVAIDSVVSQSSRAEQ